MPFPVAAIQVDGGSEFKAKFEAACQAKQIALYKLPPKPAAEEPNRLTCPQPGQRLVAGSPCW